MCVMILWGKAADRLGRKPVLVFSLAGVSVATALFGFSTEIWQMILFRCCAGVFAGTVVTVRAMISENSTPKTQARAFSWFAFASNAGIFVGPFIGLLYLNYCECESSNKFCRGATFKAGKAIPKGIWQCPAFQKLSICTSNAGNWSHWS